MTANTTCDWNCVCSVNKTESFEELTYDCVCSPCVAGIHRHRRTLGTGNAGGGAAQRGCLQPDLDGRLQGSDCQGAELVLPFVCGLG